MLKKRNLNGFKMPKLLSILIQFLLILSLVFSFGCKKEKIITDELIEKVYQQIKPDADAALLSDNPIAEFEMLAKELEKMEEVKQVATSERGLIIEFTNGKVVVWLIPFVPDENFEVLQQPSRLQALYKANLSTNSISTPKICLVNQVYDDEQFEYTHEIFRVMKESFIDENWEATVINGGQFTLNFTQNQLNDFDVVCIVTHGVNIGNWWESFIYQMNLGTYILTGEKESDNKKLTIPVTISEVRNNKKVTVTYYAIPSEYITEYYAANSFQNSLIYLAACEGLKNPEHFGKAFVDKGVKVVVGWDETNCLGAIVCKDLMYNLLDGITLSEAFNMLPENKKIDNANGTNQHPTARLTFYPISSGGDYKLPIADNDDDINDDDWVLINGVKWANRNVGTHRTFVEKPEDYGGLYQWGRKGDGHEQRNSGTTSTLSSTDTPNHSNFIIITTTYSDPNYTYDWRNPPVSNLWAAIKKSNDPCPNGYRVPTKTEIESLLNTDYVINEWTTENSIDGRRFTDIATDNTIFLPAAGRRSYSTGGIAAGGGTYWTGSSSYNQTYPNLYKSYRLIFNNSSISRFLDERAAGMSVRCVLE